MKISNELNMLANMKKGTGRMRSDKEDISNIPKSEYYKMQTSLRKMDNVQRLSSYKLIQDYSLTKHCFHTGIIFMDLARNLNIIITFEEIDFVFKHDILETVTGDLLRPAKNHNDVTEKSWAKIEEQLVHFGCTYSHLIGYTDEYAEKFMSPSALTLFKACDIYDLYLFCLEERMLGNYTIDEVIFTCQRLLSNCGVSYLEKEVARDWI